MSNTPEQQAHADMLEAMSILYTYQECFLDAQNDNSDNITICGFSFNQKRQFRKLFISECSFPSLELFGFPSVKKEQEFSAATRQKERETEVACYVIAVIKDPRNIDLLGLTADEKLVINAIADYAKAAKQQSALKKELEWSEKAILDRVLQNINDIALPVTMPKRLLERQSVQVDLADKPELVAAIIALNKKDLDNWYINKGLSTKAERDTLLEINRLTDKYQLHLEKQSDPDKKPECLHELRQSLDGHRSADTSAATRVAKYRTALDSKPTGSSETRREILDAHRDPAALRYLRNVGIAIASLFFGAGIGLNYAITGKMAFWRSEGAGYTNDSAELAGRASPKPGGSR